MKEKFLYLKILEDNFFKKSPNPQNSNIILYASKNQEENSFILKIKDQYGNITEIKTNNATSSATSSGDISISIPDNQNQESMNLIFDISQISETNQDYFDQLYDRFKKLEEQIQNTQNYNTYKTKKTQHCFRLNLLDLKNYATVFNFNNFEPLDSFSVPYYKSNVCFNLNDIKFNNKNQLSYKEAIQNNKKMYKFSKIIENTWSGYEIIGYNNNEYICSETLTDNLSLGTIYTEQNEMEIDAIYTYDGNYIITNRFNYNPSKKYYCRYKWASLLTDENNNYTEYKSGNWKGFILSTSFYQTRIEDIKKQEIFETSPTYTIEQTQDIINISYKENYENTDTGMQKFIGDWQIQDKTKKGFQRSWKKENVQKYKIMYNPNQNLWMIGYIYDQYFYDYYTTIGKINDENPWTNGSSEDLLGNEIVCKIVQNKIQNELYIDYNNGQIQKIKNTDNVKLYIQNINIPYGKKITIYWDLLSYKLDIVSESENIIQTYQNGKYKMKLFRYGNDFGDISITVEKQLSI